MPLNQTTQNKLIKASLVVLVAVAVVAAGVALKRQFSGNETETSAAEAIPMDDAALTNVEGLKDTPTLVLELFNPTDSTLHKPLNEASVRQNIEQIISTSFALNQCGLMDSDDSRDTTRAAIAYAMETKYAKDGNDALAKVMAIRKAASATYLMVYRKTDCKSPKLKEINDQMSKWQEHYLADKY